MASDLFTQLEAFGKRLGIAEIVYGVNADDACVDALLRLDQLTELDIADNDFSDVGMLRFSGMKNLRSLTVGGLDSVSEATLDKLQDLMPHCEFYE